MRSVDSLSAPRGFSTPLALPDGMGAHDWLDEARPVDDEPRRTARSGLLLLASILAALGYVTVRGLWSIYPGRVACTATSPARRLEHVYAGVSRPSFNRNTRSQRDASSGSCLTITTPYGCCAPDHEHVEDTRAVSRSRLPVGHRPARMRVGHDRASNRGALPLAALTARPMMQHSLSQPQPPRLLRARSGVMQQFDDELSTAFDVSPGVNSGNNDGTGK